MEKPNCKIVWQFLKKLYLSDDAAITVWNDKGKLNSA